VIFPDEPLLVHDRVATNKRTTRLLLLALGALLLPSALWVMDYLALTVALWVDIVTRGSLSPAGNGVHEIKAWIPIVTVASVITGFGVAWLIWTQFRLSSRRVLRLAGARVAARDNWADLLRRVDTLCIGLGMPAPTVYTIESSIPNALSTGPNPNQSAIAVTRGLLELLRPSELDAVLAHELTKIANYDTRLDAAMDTMTYLSLAPPRMVLESLRFFFGVNQLLGLVAAIYTALIVWLCGDVLDRASAYEVSRVLSHPEIEHFWYLVFTALFLYVVAGAPLVALGLCRLVGREKFFRADAEAVLLMRDPNSLASALTKVALTQNLRHRRTPSTSNSYFVKPDGGSGLPTRLLSAHPDVDSRVQLLVNMGFGILASKFDQAAQQSELYLSRFRSEYVTPSVKTSGAARPRSRRRKLGDLLVPSFHESSQGITRTEAERHQLVVNFVEQALMRGEYIESEGDYAFLLARGRPINHLMHLVMTLFSFGLWLPIWIPTAIFGRERWRLVEIDEYGFIRVRKATKSASSPEVPFVLEAA
jgi:heat shock protein HtpX